MALTAGKVFVAPRTPVEETLAKIWADVLGVKSVGIHDNYFELGGDSILSIQIIAKVAQVTGRKLPMAALFQAPTIEELSLLLHQEGLDLSSSSLVALQASGSKPPLYFVPGNLGNVLTDLGYVAHHLGPDQPFFGLQDTTGTPSQVRAMAQRYVEEIQAFQPEGPYLLGGICSGGVVAYEMAQQLQHRGQSVALLALVEAYAKRASVRNYLQVVTGLLQRLFRRFGRSVTDSAAREEHHTRTIRHRQLGAFLRLKAKVVANELGVAGYTPEPYPGRVEVFLTEESLNGYKPGVRWSQYAVGGARIHELPGTHASITGNNVEISEATMKSLAQRLAVCIDAELAEQPKPGDRSDEASTIKA